jgi:hypothetical protein
VPTAVDHDGEARAGPVTKIPKLKILRVEDPGRRQSALKVPPFGNPGDRVSAGQKAFNRKKVVLNGLEPGGEALGETIAQPDSLNTLR